MTPKEFHQEITNIIHYKTRITQFPINDGFYISIEAINGAANGHKINLFFSKETLSLIDLSGATFIEYVLFIVKKLKPQFDEVLK
jgi:hypothetical protein